MIWWAAFAAGAVVWVLWPPSSELGRLSPRVERRLPPWLAGRPDAMRLRTRLGLAVGLGWGAALWSPNQWGWVLGMALVPVLVWWLGQLEPRSAQRARDALVVQQPAVLDLLAAALEAGVPTRVATATVADVAPEESAEVLRRVVAQVSVGRDESDAWRELASDARWGPVWGPVARDLARSVHTGSGVVEMLRWQASQARLKRRAQVEKAARTVGVRSVLPLMCCHLPAFVLVGVVPIISGLAMSFVR